MGLSEFLEGYPNADRAFSRFANDLGGRLAAEPDPDDVGDEEEDDERWDGLG